MEVETRSSMEEGYTSFFKTVFNGLNIIQSSWNSINAICPSIRRMVKLNHATLNLRRSVLRKPINKTVYGQKPEDQNYAEIGEYAFGIIGKRVLSIVLYLDLYLALTGFLILEGDNLHDLFPKFKTNFHGFHIGGKQSFVILIALAFLPTVWLEDLSVLAYVSATGVVSGVVILGSVIWVGVFDGVGFHSKGELINWKGIPTAMSLYMFSYGANTVFPTLYTSMRKKHQFSKVLYIGFFFATICYSTMAILGYMMYGSTLQSQITLNLPTEKLSSKVAIYTAWISPLSKYALMMEPIATITESWFPKHHNKKGFKILLRTALVFSQVFIALAIPFFGSLMSLVGALVGGTTSITIPCLCYLKISRNDRRSIERVFIMLLAFLSMVVVVIGTYTSLKNIILETIRKH